MNFTIDYYVIKTIKQLEVISEKWQELANECQNQMPVAHGTKFKYKTGQIIPSELGEVKITWRWHGKSLNFYDVLLKDESTWTFDEEEIDLYEMIYY